MLKGTMKIELTDVHTGKKETVVEHNMITNALTNIFKSLGHLNNSSTMYNSIVPYYQKLLGGLLLFDNAIEENPNMLYAPASTNLIGCAAYNAQNNTKGTKRGGYNQTESKLNMTNRYMKFVYDFATSQANGTISCVCLTHVNGGYTSYGSDDAVLNTNYPLGVGFYDSQLQYVHTNYTGANTGDHYSGLTVGTTEVLFLIDHQNDIAYYFKIKNANSTFVVTKINTANWHITQYTMVNTTNVTLTANGMKFAFAHHGYVYLRNYNSPYSVYKFEIGNSANVVKITMKGMSSIDCSPFMAYEGHIYWVCCSSNSSSRHIYIINDQTDECLKTENFEIYSNYYNCSYTPVLNEPMLYFCSIGNYTTSAFFTPANYQ